MKNVLTTAAFFALISGVAQADSKAPVLYHDCQERITHPAGSSAHYFMSQDCSTVYVMPERTSSPRITDVVVHPEVTENLCHLLAERELESHRVLKEIGDTQERIFTLLSGSTDSEEDLQIQKLEAHSKALMKRWKELFHNEPYSVTPGATVTFKLTHEHEKQVAAYRLANKNSGLEFVRAPFKKAEVWFAGRPVEGLIGQAVVSVDFPGYSSAEVNGFEILPTLLQTGIEGNLTYSQTQVCYELEKLNRSGFNPSGLTPKTISQYIPAMNIFYSLDVKNGDEMVEQNYSAGSITVKQ